MASEQEKQKLRELVDCGYISELEFERRLTALESTVDEFETPPNMAPALSNEEVAKKVVVAFYADGSEKYTSMTIHAVKTFLENTPFVRAGLLTHTDDVKQRVIDALPEQYRDRVVHRTASATPYFANWNPTQYKLDIQHFKDEFATIFWMDSDSIVIGDMTDFLLDFARSEESLFFVPDHVMSQEDFCTRWRKQRPLTLVPQACLMGFKSDHIADFFSVWKRVWEEWITPFPFARFEDPNPGFPGSAFCIEQYALAVAISYFPQLSIRTFAREYLIIAPFKEQPGQALILQSTPTAERTQPFEFRSLGVYPTPATVGNLATYSGSFSFPLQSFGGSFGNFSFPLQSFGGSFGSFPATSWSSFLQSFSSLSLGSWSGLTVSGVSWNISGLPFDVSGGSFPGSFSNSSLSVSGGWFVDRFGGAVLHTYNQFYPAVRGMDLSNLQPTPTPPSTRWDPSW